MLNDFKAKGDYWYACRKYPEDTAMMPGSCDLREAVEELLRWRNEYHWSGTYIAVVYHNSNWHRTIDEIYNLRWLAPLLGMSEKELEGE